MQTEAKKQAIKQHVSDMLKQSYDSMIKDIDKALNSGAIDVDSWQPDNKPMILPKCITTALLIKESKQYEAKGTSYEKEVKKEVNNILHFI